MQIMLSSKDVLDKQQEGETAGRDKMWGGSRLERAR
jgi:hypothetical protein